MFFLDQGPIIFISNYFPIEHKAQFLHHIKWKFKPHCNPLQSIQYCFFAFESKWYENDGSMTTIIKSQYWLENKKMNWYSMESIACHSKNYSFLSNFMREQVKWQMKWAQIPLILNRLSFWCTCNSLDSLKSWNISLNFIASVEFIQKHCWLCFSTQ